MKVGKASGQDEGKITCGCVVDVVILVSYQSVSQSVRRLVSQSMQEAFVDIS